METKYKVASVQAIPALPMDKKATTQKACSLIEEAGRNGARLVVFPECFIPMFPNWSVDMSRPSEWSNLLAELTRNAVEVPGDETKMIAQAARRAGVFVCMGINERDRQFRAALYNSLVFFGPEGEILGKHRKLTPSHRERVFHARGDGTDMRCVFDTEIGRIGGLICYEHLQPLFKYTLMSQGEEVHCACWPGWPHFPGSRSNKHVIDVASRQYALEGACYVVVSSTWIPEEMSEQANLGNAHWGFVGGAGVINPHGEYIAGPVYGEETIVYAEVDRDEILKRKAYIDVVGRDARWDVLRLHWEERAYRPYPVEPSRAYATEVARPAGVDMTVVPQVAVPDGSEVSLNQD